MLLLHRHFHSFSTAWKNGLCQPAQPRNDPVLFHPSHAYFALFYMIPQFHYGMDQGLCVSLPSGAVFLHFRNRTMVVLLFSL
jgi:hypothetical protein